VLPHPRRADQSDSVSGSPLHFTPHDFRRLFLLTPS
jgi:hypothetical protein